MFLSTIVLAIQLERIVGLSLLPPATDAQWLAAVTGHTPASAVRMADLAFQHWTIVNNALETNGIAPFLSAPMAVRLQSHRDETSRRMQIWVIVRLILEPEVPDARKRKYLATLQEMIGPEAYFKGEIPDPIPRWSEQFKR